MRGKLERTGQDEKMADDAPCLPTPLTPDRHEGSCIAVQYRKSVTQPTPIAAISVDGAHELLLDGNFREVWGDCLYLDTVAEGLENKVHTVTVRLVQTHGEDKVPFYLVSIIGS